MTYADLDRGTQLALGAFKLAMRELGVPDHPDRKCPTDPCNHAVLADAVEKRAIELVSDPGLADAEVCHDCKVLLPFPIGPAYAIDSASVCEPCARDRYGDQASEYLIA